MLILILIVTIILLYLYQRSNLENINVMCPVINGNFKVSGDIDIKPVGCFININDTFFTSCINPYSKESVQDSGISVNNFPEDILTVIKRVINNGYDLYGNKILNNYRGTDYSQLKIIELATLGYLCGYKFISITNESSKNKVFFSYSQPLSRSDGAPGKPDLPFKLMTKVNGYTNEVENAPNKDLICGIICLQNGKPQTDNFNSIYTCGSTLYPNITTPPRYSVYEIYEKN
jgi:hypothetical protein